MKKKLVTALLVLAVMAAALPFAAAAGEKPGGYDDIEGSWYSEAAAKYAYGDIFLDGGGKFYPQKAVTRMEFARLLHRVAGISIQYFAEPRISDHFDDVAETDAGASALIDMATAGILGDSASFFPAAPLDRETMIRWTVRTLNYVTGGQFPMILIMPAPFDDDGDISSDAARNDIIKAVVLGITKGRGDNMLYPAAAATRGEAVTVAARLVDLLDTFKPDVAAYASAGVSDGALTMTLRIVNNMDAPVTIDHTSGQRYDFKVFDASGVHLYTWSADKSFIMALGTTVLEPGQAVLYSETLEGDGFDQIIRDAHTVTAYITGASEDFTVSADGYTALVE